ncbi:Chitinase II,Glycoside hydrolase superfamily,Chitin binding domain,Glycoside hydrolase [Cinara cedri]|uniref:Chitinase II,Glycoside hydrolase superfamily,Chitin binding domain,Glycoside hydrolase n=1 Tax=Cinara cedri TaxID=506608 RepID=A0A5E4M1C9_9HEMI|nr:Chitinase II,Glycoside hydrolase superfamily,Chitin binding domain,Glycoside hydrolase [Cinara cedri]
MAKGPRLCVLLATLLLFIVDWTSAENIQKCDSTPMKQIICEFGTAKAISDFDPCLCTHIAVPVSLESEKDDETPDLTSTIKSYKQTNGDLKSLAAVSMYVEDIAKKTNQICKEIVDILAHYDGAQLDLRQSDVSVDKSLVVQFFKELSFEIDNKFKEDLSNNSTEVFKKDIQLVLPPNAAIMTKYYDLKKLSKFVDFFIIATHNLVDSSEQGYTYHPSRLMGADDLLNADSLIDLVIGLGVDHSSILLSLPSTAIKFELKNTTQNTPRSPAIGLPTTITRQNMCEQMKEGNWTIERDEDLTAPYAFMNKTWMSFDDRVSVSIKGKYILLRDLAGVVVTDIEALDWKLTCLNQTDIEPLTELTKTFTETARKSRSAQLLSLQEQLQRPADQGLYFNNEISYSPYYIERVVTRDGEVHVIRKDTKTEFECSRQGYFRHPSGCNRFYRCVKFDQQSNYFTVYEYDCPDGLAFDEKVEVCVWPGSLSNTGACQGSSEIAPVPRNQFLCPPIEGYYADPENCRWFFACLDHAKDGYTPLTAYEFRCPFGLVFDEKSLKCDWQWKVGSCGTSGITHANNYREQSYQPNQFNTLYGNEQFVVPYEKYSQDQPQFSFDSVDTYVAPNKFNLPYPTTSKPQFSYDSTANYAKQNVPQSLYSSGQSYSPPNNPQIPYSLPDSYINPINSHISYSSTETYPSTVKPQPLYGLTGTYVTSKKPEFYGSTESYATTSRPQLFYGSTEGYSSTIKPQYSYSSTETYTTKSKPEFSYGPYGPSESYSTTGKPQFPSNEANAYLVPNQSSYSPEYYYQFGGPLGVLYHQQHDSEVGSQYHNGFIRQQNNFQSIPVNNNYDSHKNDVQYPPIKDFETHTTTQGPVNKIPNTRLYSDYSSNIYLNPSVPYGSNINKNSYSILGGANGYDSHKVNEQYQPLYNFEAYSTTSKPIVKLPEIQTYSQSNIYFEPTSKPFEEYSHEISRSSFNEEPKSQYSNTESPINYKYSSPSNTDFNNYHISSTSQKPILHDTSLYKEQFKSQFNFEDYLSRISSEQYPSSTPIVNYTPSIHGNNYAQTSSIYSTTTPKPTIFYYSSSPTLSPYKETSDAQSYSTSSNVKLYTENYDSSISTEKATNYKLPISSTYDSHNYNPTVSPSAHTPTFKPTVDYYNPSSIVSNDDSIFVEQLISKLSKAPISTSYSTSTLKPLYSDYTPQPAADYIPNDSFNIDEYIANLSESIENSTPKPLYSSTSYKPSDVPYSSSSYESQPIPTTVFLSSTENPKTFNQESYSALSVQSTTCKPEASIKISAPKIQYVPSLESVFSVKPPVTYTQKPEPLVGYSSTVSNLLNYYHSVHSSLDSAYRSPLPRYYSPPVGSSLYTNYTLPREYEKDAEHNVHAAYPAYPLKPIIVEPVSPELNAEFERYYTAGIRNNLRSEDNGKVLVVGDTNPLLVGKLGAQCDCAKKKKPVIVSTTTRTVIESDEDEEDEKTLAVKEVETKTKVILEEVKKPSNKKLCTRPGLFRDPKQCNKFYSCNWDKWTQKYELSEFKCPIHLSFDENLSACNWPSKGPACSHDKLINYTN